MNVLVLGSGGREHALAHALARSPQLTRLFVAPGNAGTAALATNLSVDLGDVPAVCALARTHGIDLTVVGPEAPLCAGIVDHFERKGMRIFGPSAAAARIEGAKDYAKELMRRALVPTAEARVFDDYMAARTYTATRDCPLVVKAAGLAAGKGVVLCDDPSEALLALERIMVEGQFGEAGRTVLVEQRLEGPEMSVLAIVDDTTMYVLETAQDYKKIGENDTGPNTGGMGAVSPAPRADDALLDRIERDVFVPIVDAMRGVGVTYRGVLYAGLILTAAGPKVLEFNCRFGDPEAQVILPRIRSDALALLDACASGRLNEAEIDWDPRSAVTVVLASAGYPGRYEGGKIITGLEDAAAIDGVTIYHAGTALADGKIITNGGRVLSVTALAENVVSARARAYQAASMIHFEGAYLRRDIAA